VDLSRNEGKNQKKNDHSVKSWFNAQDVGNLIAVARYGADRLYSLPQIGYQEDFYSKATYAL